MTIDPRPARRPDPLVQGGAVRIGAVVAALRAVKVEAEDRPAAESARRRAA
jgi:hypothetical protein